MGEPSFLKEKRKVCNDGGWTLSEEEKEKVIKNPTCFGTVPCGI
jgi:hypothetical protein